MRDHTVDIGRFLVMAAFGAALLAVASCGVPPPLQPAPEPTGEKGVVCIYRAPKDPGVLRYIFLFWAPSTWYGGEEDVFDGVAKVGSVRRGTYFKYLADPGPHPFAPAGSVRFTPINVEAGKTHYLEAVEHRSLFGREIELRHRPERGPEVIEGLTYYPPE